MTDNGVLRFRPPGKEEPGYLRRLRGALEFQEKLSKEPSPDLIDDLIEFLLPYIVEPNDRNRARDMLWDATEQQFWDLLNAVTGESAENPIQEQ